MLADAGHSGAGTFLELKGRKRRWHRAAKRSIGTEMADRPSKHLAKQAEHLEAKIRARVVYPCCILKDLFGYCNVCHRGLAKNTTQMQVLFAPVNLVIAKKAPLA